MEEINLKEMFNYFVNKLPLMLLIMFVVIASGCCYSIFLQKPLYSSSTTIVLARAYFENSSSSEINQNDLTLNQKLVSTYREIIRSKSILKEVIEDLDLDITYGALYNSVKVDSVKDTEIIKVTVSYENPKTARNIAAKIAEIFSKEIVEIYNIQNVRVLDEAEIDNTPYNINAVKQIVLYVLVGMVIAVGVTFVIFYLDTTIKNVEEVERRIELPILGAVPEKRLSGKGKK